MTTDNQTPLEMPCQWERETPDAVFLGKPKALKRTECTGHLSLPLCLGPLAFELQGAV